MTFAQQIENVPLKLVQQGFRRHPSESLWYRWQETDGVKDPHWQMIRLPDGTKVSRPVCEIAKGVVVYAHVGWGDGLLSNIGFASMAQIWPYWWFAKTTSEGTKIHACPVRVGHTGDLYWRYPFQMAEDVKLADYHMVHLFRGPVLPPADIS